MRIKKINKILFIIYLYEKSPVKFEEFQIVHTFKWEPSKSHSKLIQRDYTIIRNKKNLKNNIDFANLTKLRLS